MMRVISTVNSSKKLPLNSLKGRVKGNFKAVIQKVLLIQSFFMCQTLASK